MLKSVALEKKGRIGEVRLLRNDGSKFGEVTSFERQKLLYKVCAVHIKKENALSSIIQNLFIHTLPQYHDAEIVAEILEI